MAGDQLGAVSSAQAGITSLAKNRQQKETDVRDRHRFLLAWVQSAATDNSLTEHHVAKPDRRGRSSSVISLTDRGSDLLDDTAVVLPIGFSIRSCIEPRQASAANLTEPWCASVTSHA